MCTAHHILFGCGTKRAMMMTSHVSGMGERRDVYRNLVGKPKEKTALGKPRRRWEDHIETDLQRFRWEHRLN